jgi:nicotinamide mononucleotide transporter
VTEALLDALGALTLLEGVAVLLAIAYLLLVIRQNILCWPAAFASTVLYLVIFTTARLYMEAALQVFYAAMAVYGWHHWRSGARDPGSLPIRTWPLRRHVIALLTIGLLTAAFGTVLGMTSAALPFADSFTTVAALLATWMVARKVLENWWYWFVIDSVSVYLYVNRELWLTAALFCLYLVLIAVGYWQWRDQYQAQQKLVTP